MWSEIIQVEDDSFDGNLTVTSLDLRRTRYPLGAGKEQSSLFYLGNENLSSCPSEHTGFLRLRINFMFSESLEKRVGMAMVESEWTVTMLASWAILPHLCASSSVQPDRPPQCGASVTT